LSVVGIVDDWVAYVWRLSASLASTVPEQPMLNQLPAVEGSLAVTVSASES
jgi:hypothetical protein